MTGPVAKFLAYGGPYDTLGFDLFIRFGAMPVVALAWLGLAWLQGVELHAQKGWAHRHLWDSFVLLLALCYCIAWCDKWWALWKFSPVLAVAAFAGLWYWIGRHYVRKWRREARERRAQREAAVAHLPAEEQARVLARPRSTGRQKIVAAIYIAWALACIIGGIIALIRHL